MKKRTVTHLNGLWTTIRKKSSEYRGRTQGRQHFASESIDKPNPERQPLKPSLKCLYTNLDGIGNKTGELEDLLSQENPDLVFLTETKCNSELLSVNLFDVNKYSVIRKDRETQNAPGGGVALLVNKELIVEEASVSDLVNHGAQETVWCEISNKVGKNIVLGSIYRPPSSSEENNGRLCDLIRLSETSTQGKQILVCGDFNYGAIKWEDNIVEPGSYNRRQAENFLEAVNDNFWHQHVADWTHLRTTDNPSRLDLIFSNSENDVGDINYLPPIGLSKHAVLSFNLFTDVPKEQECDQNKLNYHKTDIVKLKDMLGGINWKEMLAGKSANERYNSFIESYTKVVKECVPIYRSRQANHTPKWMDRRLQMLVKRKKEAWERYRDRKSAVRREHYNAARNTVTREVKTAKYNYERRVALDSVNNAKHFWAYVRSKTTAKDRITRVKTLDGEYTGNDQETATAMNTAFNGVFVEEETDGALPVPTMAFQGPKMQDVEITIQDVRTRLKKLNPSKAPGPDGVSPLILKECADILCHPLQDIFRTSIIKGEVPSEWKKANITPIYKKGNRSDALNYRPVSLTSVVSKVLEGIIRQKIVGHLEENDLITNAQHGFRNKRSCLTNMLCYLDDLVNEVDNGNCVDIAYLDCEKAFDRVPHHRLNLKLEAMGIGGKILKWIDSFLNDRLHRVTIRDSYSDWLPMKSGVPQGSVLGPVLFLIYINDLVTNLESSASLFADDAKIYKTIESETDVETLRRDMAKLDEWCGKWLLSFNTSKCKVMHIGHNNRRNAYQLDGVTLEKSNEEKDLGIIISSDLKSTKHVAKITAKANSRLGIIKRNFSVLNKEILLPLYLSLVRPILDFGVQCWSPYMVKDIQALEKIQRRATKLVPDLHALPYIERCKHLGLQTLSDRRKRGDMIETYKILHGLEGIPDTQFFQRNTNHLRGHSLKLSKPTHWRTTLKGNWFPVRVVNHWNALPESVVTAPTIAIFKQRYDKYTAQAMT